MTQDMYLELYQRLLELDRAPAYRVAILRAFSAGGNLKVYHGSRQSLPELAWVQSFRHPFAPMDPRANAASRVTIFGYRTTKPLIAAINGPCLGPRPPSVCRIEVFGRTASFTGLNQ
jgi:enoyl-CoA hydratase/carnithine racemase